jgi:hypothetical protein
MKSIVGLAAIVFLSCAAIDLNAAVVTGVVVDEAKHPIPGAKIRALDGNTALNQFPEVASLQGHYTLNLASFGGDHLTLEVQASGYVTARVAVLISNSETAVAPITLSKALGLVAQPLQTSDVPDHKTRIFETELTNEAADPLTIHNIDILLSQEAKIDCADISPAVLLVIDAAARNPAVHISVPGRQYTDDRALSGSIEQLPCGVSRVKLEFPLSMTVAGKSHDRLRIDVPVEVKAYDQGKFQSVKLKEYRYVVVRFFDTEKVLAETKSF